MNTLMMKKIAALFLLLAASLLSTTASAVSPLATDLQSLVADGNGLNTQLSGVTLTADNLCGELLDANQAVNSYLDQISAFNAGLAGPLSLDADSLTALNDLSTVSLNLANQALSLSLDVNTLSTSVSMLDIADGLSAMLQLSSDIGTMADRILEMADNILLMADNIGLMADRIIETQEIQNQNIALTQGSILSTQENILLLVSVVDSSSYNTALQNLVTSGNWLTLDMELTAFAPWNLASKMSAIATDVANYRDQLVATENAISLDAASNTLTINQDSLNTLADMSLMISSMSIVLEAYSIMIQGMAPMTSDPSLTSTMDSMLQMSADIGLMANRILEMSDQILAMADNIGLAADNIVATQSLQNMNIAAAQTAVLSSQTMSIGLIAILTQ